jgi:hypothetical protein
MSGEEFVADVEFRHIEDHLFLEKLPCEDIGGSQDNAKL